MPLANASGERLVLDRVELLHVRGPVQVLGAFAIHDTHSVVYSWNAFPPFPYRRADLRRLRGAVVPPHSRDYNVLVEVRLSKRMQGSASSMRLSYHSGGRRYRDDLPGRYVLRPVTPTRACRNEACRWTRIVDDWVSDGLIERSQAPAAHDLVRYGCADCHTYRNIGATNLDAPDLTFGGPHRFPAKRIVALLRCPTCLQPDSPMPRFARLPKRELARIAAFLVASR
jgi:mono/diheme cytochrome c family protein